MHPRTRATAGQWTETLSRDMRDIYSRGVQDALRRDAGLSHASYTRRCEVKACMTDLPPRTDDPKTTERNVETRLTLTMSEVMGRPALLRFSM